MLNACPWLRYQRPSMRSRADPYSRFLEALLHEAGGSDGWHCARTRARSLHTSLPVFIRSLVGLEREAATQAFAQLVAGGTASARQLQFIGDDRAAPDRARRHAGGPPVCLALHRHTRARAGRRVGCSQCGAAFFGTEGAGAAAGSGIARAVVLRGRSLRRCCTARWYAVAMAPHRRALPTAPAAFFKNRSSWRTARLALRPQWHANAGAACARRSPFRSVSHHVFFL